MFVNICHEIFGRISAWKDLIIKKFAKFFKIPVKIKIVQNIEYVISQQIFWWIQTNFVTISKISPRQQH